MPEEECLRRLRTLWTILEAACEANALAISINEASLAQLARATAQGVAALLELPEELVDRIRRDKFEGLSTGARGSGEPGLPRLTVRLPRS